MSIITPFLNPGPFLSEAVQSVVAQTYRQWELLLVDDGGTDGSAARAKAYAAEHPGRIRCLSHEGRANRGASASRNLGTSVSRGEFIAFLDADDVYLPHKLEEQVALLDAHPEAGMLYGGTEYWYGWTGRPEDRARDRVWRHFGVPANTCVDPPQLLVTFLRDPGTVPCMGSVLARKAAIDAAGGWHDGFTRICTDQVFHARMALTVPIFIADGCWDRYRQHPDSECHRAARAGEAEAALVRYRLWLEQELSRRNVREPDVWTALDAALRPHRHPWRHWLERRASVLAAHAGRLRPGRT